MADVDNFLEHYGVKGMRWGVRAKSKNPTKGYSRDAKTAVNIRKKSKTSPVKVKALSNKEIETFLTRVSLESRFTQATPGRGKRALNVVKDLLGTGRTVNEVAAFANTPTGKQIRNGFEKPKQKITDKRDGRYL
jgi:hypothetical protein